MSFVISPLPKLIGGFGLIIAAAAAVSAPESTQAQTIAYTVTELSADDATQVPGKLNNLGDLVGRGSRGTVAAQIQALFWNHSNFAKKHLGVFAGGDYSSATGINDAGAVTGASNTGTGIIPFLWTGKGGMKRVPFL